MSRQIQPLSKKSYFLLDFGIAGVSATITKTLFTPVQNIQLKLLFYKQSLQTIMKAQGWRLLWKGSMSNIFRYAPIQALNFSLKDTFQRYLANSLLISTFKNTFLTNFISGSFAGIITLAIVYPMDMPRVRIAQYYLEKLNKRQSSQYHGIFVKYRAIFSQYFLFFTVYRGFIISALATFLYRGLYFGVYDSSKPFIKENFGDSFIISFYLGWISTLLASFLSFPIDTLRRNFMLRQSKAILQSVVQIVKEKTFFKGSHAVIIRSISGGLLLATYDFFHQMLSAAHFMKSK